jgi:hypothetical protein
MVVGRLAPHHHCLLAVREEIPENAANANAGSTPKCVVTDRVSFYACTVKTKLPTEVGTDRASRPPIDTTDSGDMLLCIHRGVFTMDGPR